jgi:hypothetical protein
MVEYTPISEFKNCHKGERIFILGNGPSLNEINLENLNNELTFAVNRINLIFDETDWRPTYYVFDDIRFDGFGFKPFITESIEAATHSFINSSGKKFLKDVNEGVTFYDQKYDRYEENIDINNMREDVIENGDLETLWSHDLENDICNFGTTISVPAQIANYMGCDRLYFLGCDLYEPVKKPFMIFGNGDDPTKFTYPHKSRIKNYFEMLSWSKTPVRTSVHVFLLLLMKYAPYDFWSQESHFTESYVGKNFPDTADLNDEQRKMHQVVKLASEEYGFEVYNATPGGYLDTYDRVDLRDVLSESE